MRFFRKLFGGDSDNASTPAPTPTTEATREVVSEQSPEEGE